MGGGSPATRWYVWAGLGGVVLAHALLAPERGLSVPQKGFIVYLLFLYCSVEAAGG